MDFKQIKKLLRIAFGLNEYSKYICTFSILNFFKENHLEKEYFSLLKKIRKFIKILKNKDLKIYTFLMNRIANMIKNRNNLLVKEINCLNFQSH